MKKFKPHFWSIPKTQKQNHFLKYWTKIAEDFISQMRRSHPELSQEEIEKVLEQFQQMLGDKRLRPRAELTPESSYDSDDCDKETAYQTDA